MIAVARIAGIMAAKKTSDLIPLCHPLMLDKVSVEIVADPALPGLRVTATARLTGKTGVEMEALTAVGVACLTIYDMAKAVDRSMVINGVRLLEKSGGRSGDWTADHEPDLCRGRLPAADAGRAPRRGHRGCDAPERARPNPCVRSSRPAHAAGLRCLRHGRLRAEGSRRRLGPPSGRRIGRGRAFDGVLRAGEAVRIFTGAPVPEGADSILIQENAGRPTDATLRALGPVVPGRHIRKAGADFSRDETLIVAGTRARLGGHRARRERRTSDP